MSLITVYMLYIYAFRFYSIRIIAWFLQRLKQRRLQRAPEPSVSACLWWSSTGEIQILALLSQLLSLQKQCRKGHGSHHRVLRFPRLSNMMLFAVSSAHNKHPRRNSQCTGPFATPSVNVQSVSTHAPSLLSAMLCCPWKSSQSMPSSRSRWVSNRRTDTSACPRGAGARSLLDGA